MTPRDTYMLAALVVLCFCVGFLGGLYVFGQLLAP
jgi:hypothetical protein